MKIYCNTLFSRKESKVYSGYCKLGRTDVRNVIILVITVMMKILFLLTGC